MEAQKALSCPASKIKTVIDVVPKETRCQARQENNDTRKQAWENQLFPSLWGFS